MNKRVRNRWVKALRSKKYNQGTGWLCEGSNYCCLGVLADIELDGWWQRDDTYHSEKPVWRLVGEGGKKTGNLPGPFLLRVGLTHEAQARLISLNDEEHRSFDEIAKWIKDNL